MATAFLSSSPISSSRSASEASTAALIAAIRPPSDDCKWGSDSKCVLHSDSSVESDPPRTDFGELGEELSDLASLFGAGEIEETVHLAVGDIGEQRLSGGTRLEQPPSTLLNSATSSWLSESAASLFGNMVTMWG